MKKTRLITIGIIVGLVINLCLSVLGALAYNPGGHKGTFTVGTSAGLPLMLAPSGSTGPLLVMPASIGVPDNSSNWTTGVGSIIAYADNISISVSGTRTLLYDPNDIISGTTLPDRTGNGNDGVITWGTNPSGINIAIGSFTASGTPATGSTDTTTTTDNLPVVGGDMNTQPDISGALATNPIRPIITAISDNTSLTELQAWRWLGIAFVMFVTGVTAINVRSHQGITGVALGAALALVTAMTIFPAWVYLPAALLVIGGLVSERSPSL